MEVVTRYNVSPHFHNDGTSRKTSTEVVTNTNCLGVYNSPDIIPTQVSSLPNDIVVDILSRLPVKPLMQFKSVCKHWLFMIKQDTHFINLHCIRSKSRLNLLYVNPMPEKGLFSINPMLDICFRRSKTLQQNISCAEIVEGSTGGDEEQVESIVSKVRITDDQWFIYNQILEPVNGLVCFVNQNTHAIRVYNASTREATPWVKSTLLAEENHKLASKDRKMIKSLREPIYRFGFDPEKREHKVFCFWRLVARREHHRYNSFQQPDYESCEALTVGRDTRWRRINAVPNENNRISIKQALPPTYNSWQQVYADGTMYWFNQGNCRGPWNYNHDDPDVIVAFDVGIEKYRVIPIPNFILNEPRDETCRKPIDMLALGRHVALIYRTEPYVVKLWMLDDGAGKKLENCRGNRSNWSAETITLPFCCDDGFASSGIAGSTDKIVFKGQGCRDYGCLMFTCYSYDLSKKTFKKIEMDGVASFKEYSERSLITTFTESLFPVQPLNKTKVT
ncbi:hypothetical protein MKX01_006975 [Papaver californicum]|nr:hypothetical protein MKX01_006975 [Papaver californicum]